MRHGKIKIMLGEAGTDNSPNPSSYGNDDDDDNDGVHVSYTHV
jgi:hypothetical protein